MNKYNRVETSLVNIENHHQRQDSNKNKTTIQRTQSEKLLLPKKTVGIANESTVSQRSSGKNLKLRDYLFLVGVNSKRNHAQHDARQEKTTTLTPSASAHCLKNSVSTRSIKYGIDSKHVQTVVAQELQEDLEAIMTLTNTIKTKISKILHSQKLGQEDMVEVYAMRRTLKEKILKELASVDEIVKSLENQQVNQQTDIEQRVGLSMSIICEKQEDEDQKNIKKQKAKKI